MKRPRTSYLVKFDKLIHNCFQPFCPYEQPDDLQVDLEATLNLLPSLTGVSCTTDMCYRAPLSCSFDQGAVMRGQCGAVAYYDEETVAQKKFLKEIQKVLMVSIEVEMKSENERFQPRKAQKGGDGDGMENSTSFQK